MNGKAPQTILTDQNICLKEALSAEMSITKHAFCIWMIVAKFPSWFNAVLGERYNEWKAEFYRLYNLESVEDFELGWREMVCSFGLHSNRHMVNLYSSRSLWALPYLRSHFLAGMTTTGQSKSINAFIQRFLSAQTRLAHFVEQVLYLPVSCFDIVKLDFQWLFKFHSEFYPTFWRYYAQDMIVTRYDIKQDNDRI
jgi:hypothetical protein